MPKRLRHLREIQLVFGLVFLLAEIYESWTAKRKVHLPLPKSDGSKNKNIKKYSMGVKKDLRSKNIPSKQWKEKRNRERTPAERATRGPGKDVCNTQSKNLGEGVQYVV